MRLLVLKLSTFVSVLFLVGSVSLVFGYLKHLVSDTKGPENEFVMFQILSQNRLPKVPSVEKKAEFVMFQKMGSLVWPRGGQV